MNVIYIILFLFGQVFMCQGLHNTTKLDKIKLEISKYKDIANDIIQLSVHGAAQNQSYNRLANMADKFGSRLAGSQSLEHAIENTVSTTYHTVSSLTSGQEAAKGEPISHDVVETYTDPYAAPSNDKVCILDAMPVVHIIKKGANMYYMLDELSADKLDNVHGESALVPHWVRGDEMAMMTEPRPHLLPMLGLGYSVGTGPHGIKAEAIVVTSFDELKARADEVPGKIVVYNQDFISYGVSVEYRVIGASEAAKLGGVASLIRSVTPLSVDSPHTGMQMYEQNVTQIPTACITVEDAEMMWRMSQNGEKIVVFLNMSAENLEAVFSRNTVAEITGSTHPEQVVLVSGHLDSWDVGQGAMDDGGGAFISWQALSLVRQLGLRPKRTLRLVMWTAEEFGGMGADAYYQQHKQDVNNFDLVLESDLGTFTPQGIQFKGNAAATAIMAEVVKLLKPINASLLEEGGGGGDIAPWMEAGVPGGSIKNANDRYFYWHHSNGDTMTVQDPVAMNLCSAAWAITAYVVANMDDMLPRDSKPSVTAN